LLILAELGWLALAGAALAADGPRLFYSKAFPGSVPAYMQVTVEQGGAVEYKEAPEDDFVLKFKLSPAETESVFGLAEKLGHFKAPLESGLKVAFMGKKTFRWESGGEKSEQQFNYSTDTDAQALLDWFEKMSESAQMRLDLEKAAKYDRLGVDKALRTLLGAMDRKRLVGLEQYLPMLDRIANNDSYMHTARAKAAEMAEAIRKPLPAASGSGEGK
jgi:hypothetical protein